MCKTTGKKNKNNIMMFTSHKTQVYQLATRKINH